MGMSDREHDIIMWRDLQISDAAEPADKNHNRAAACPSSCSPSSYSSSWPTRRRTFPAVPTRIRATVRICRSDGTTSGVSPTSSALTQGQLTSDDLALELLRAEARPPIEAQLIDKWVPQIGSYEVNGDTSDKDILSSQRTQQTQFQALLLMTDDYTTATPGYWVSIAPVPSESADGALAWCADQNLDLDHCFARFITHDPAVTDISKH